MIMKRIIDYFLREWKSSGTRKPLLLRGARQVGKTHAARNVGLTFESFVEINLETNKKAQALFEESLDVELIVVQLEAISGVKIIPGKTLLFLDEIQQVPQAITALRYFYEKMPSLHVIAAGSLLDFALEQVGAPVGRITTRYMYPLSFIEFLVAIGHRGWAKAIMKDDAGILKYLHKDLIRLVATYIAIGGMPEAVSTWLKAKHPTGVKGVHLDLLYAYRKDFNKYAKKYQIKYLNLLFDEAFAQLCCKFIFAKTGYQKREIAPALDLIDRAGIMYKIIRTAAQGIPLGAFADVQSFKLIFLDVGLMQALLKLDISHWFVDPLENGNLYLHKLVNKGNIIEAFVGQELLAYTLPLDKSQLFYWHREFRSSSAEVDYVIQLGQEVVPVEVKAGESLRIKSMHMFLESHPGSAYGIRFWSGGYAEESTLHSYPLYAVVKPLIDADEGMKAALYDLVSEEK